MRARLTGAPAAASEPRTCRPESPTSRLAPICRYGRAGGLGGLLDNLYGLGAYGGHVADAFMPVLSPKLIVPDTRSTPSSSSSFRPTALPAACSAPTATSAATALLAPARRHDTLSRTRRCSAGAQPESLPRVSPGSRETRDGAVGHSGPFGRGRACLGCAHLWKSAALPAATGAALGRSQSCSTRRGRPWRRSRVVWAGRWDMGLGGADAQGLPSLPDRPGSARDEISVRPAHLTAPLTSVALLPAATTLPYRLRRAGKPGRHRLVLGRPVSHPQTHSDRAARAAGPVPAGAAPLSSRPSSRTARSGRL